MTGEGSHSDVLLISADLFLGSRVRGSVESSGWTLDVAGSGTQAAERLQSASRYRLVLIDLETPGLQIAELMTPRPDDDPPAVIAYGPHVHEQRLEAARQAGCDEVLTRGRFDATLPRLLEEHLTGRPT